MALLKLCSDAKLLGLTATNIRYLDNDCDVSKELFDGHIASEMTLGEAIVRGILPTPNYVTAAGERLGQWVASQQWAYPKGKLTDEQVERLNRIGMYWGNRNDRQWNEGYQEARRYFDAHGDLNVPAGYVSPDGYDLGNWVKRQRYTRHNPEKSCAVLTEERIAKLDAVGMQWEKTDSWQHRYELAQEYKKEYGNLDIPAKYKTADGIWLSRWVYNQKRLLQSGSEKLSEEQKKKLKELLGYYVKISA